MGRRAPVPERPRRQGGDYFFMPSFDMPESFCIPFFDIPSFDMLSCLPIPSRDIELFDMPFLAMPSFDMPSCLPMPSRDIALFDMPSLAMPSLAIWSAANALPAASARHIEKTQVESLFMVRSSWLSRPRRG